MPKLCIGTGFAYCGGGDGGGTPPAAAPPSVDAWTDVRGFKTYANRPGALVPGITCTAWEDGDYLVTADLAVRHDDRRRVVSGMLFAAHNELEETTRAVWLQRADMLQQLTLHTVIHLRAGDPVDVLVWSDRGVMWVDERHLRIMRVTKVGGP